MTSTVCKQLCVCTCEVVLKMIPNVNVPFQAEIKGEKETITVFLKKYLFLKTKNKQQERKKEKKKEKKTNKISPSSGVSFATHCGPGGVHSGICSTLLRCAVNEYGAVVC